jgi:hypothetical protein
VRHDRRREVAALSVDRVHPAEAAVWLPAP